MHELNVLQLDFADWHGVLLLDQVVVPSAHEHGDLGPHGWRDSGTSHSVALGDHNIKVNNWYRDAGSQLLVGLSDNSVELRLNLSLELSGVDAKSGLKVFCLNGSNGNWRKLAKNLTRLSVDCGNSIQVGESGLNSLFLINGDGDLQIALGRCLTISEVDRAWTIDKLAGEANSLARSVLGEDLWDEHTEVICCHVDIQVLREEVGDVECVSGREA